MKKTLILSLLMVIAFGVQASTTFYVNIATGNDASSGTTWTTCFRTVQKALAAANASSASDVDVWVAAGTYTPTDGLSSVPSDPSDTSFAIYRINGRALKVYGGFAGTETSISARDTSHTTFLDGIISSGNSYHIAVIAGLSPSADSVVIDGFTFSNGIATNSGVKAYNGVGVQQYNGGGIVIANDSSSKIALTNCIFYNNTTVGYLASSTTSGFSGRGGGAYISAPCLIDNCNFRSNSNTAPAYLGTDAYGGGLFVNNTSVMIQNSTFSNNFAYGGNPTSYYLLNGSGYGGGICFQQSPNSVVQNCHFVGNYVQSGIGSYYYGGNAYGGGICNVNSGTLVRNCQFHANNQHYHNSYSNSYYCGSGICNLFSSSSINNCVFDSSEADRGAFFDSSSFDSVNLCRFINNTAGGGVYVKRSTAPFTQCMIMGNGGYGATITSGSNSLFKNCSLDSNGGGLNNYASLLEMTNCSFVGNQGSGLYTSQSNPMIDSCIFDGNISAYGAGIELQDSSVTPTRCIFRNNYAYYEGGAIYAGSTYYYTLYNTRFNCSGNVFINNSAPKGGAIRTDLCNTCGDSLFNNIFIGNKCTDTTSGGGAILVGGSRNYIYNNTFLYDTALGHGGAIRIEGTSGLTKVANNIFYRGQGSGTSRDTSLAGTGSLLFYNNIYTGTNPFFRDTVNLIGVDNVWGTSDDGLELQPCSPGVDAGNNAYVVYGEATDITGNSRILNTTVDIGAYEARTVGAISGTPLLCIGSSTMFTDTTSGGTWSSSDTTIATVSGAGLVSGVSLGAAVISYTHSTGCGSRVATYVVSTESPVAALTGHDTLCFGTTVMLSDTLAGGTWMSSNTTIANVDSTGLVSGLRYGVDTIVYSFTNSCGTTHASKRIVVQGNATSISGADSICVGTTATYGDSAAGGTWRSANTAIATINSTGQVTAVSPGMDSIIYIVNNTCGISTAYIIVNVQRAASRLVSADSFCMTSGSYTFTDSVAGGTWWVSDTAVLGATSTPGNYSFLTAGADTVNYTLTNACGTSRTSKRIVIQGPVATITGASSVCIGSTATYSDSTFGGTWRSSATTSGTITAAGLFTGILPGVDTIFYTANNICGVTTSHILVNVERRAGPVTGSLSFCTGIPTPFTDSATGGTWSSSNTTIATVDAAGNVTGLTAGSVNITYALTNSCGTSSALLNINITAPPPTAVITGADTVCQGHSISLSASAAGGVWAASNGNATVYSSGVVNGVNAGLVTISYTITNSCGHTTTTLPILVHSIGYCDSASSVPSVVYRSGELLVRPNPAHNFVTLEIQSDKNEMAVIVLTNLLGQKVKEWTIATNQPVETDLGIAAGVYVLTATTNNIKYVTKLIIE